MLLSLYIHVHVAVLQEQGTFQKVLALLQTCHKRILITHQNPVTSTFVTPKRLRDHSLVSHKIT